MYDQLLCRVRFESIFRSDKLPEHAMPLVQLRSVKTQVGKYLGARWNVRIGNCSAKSQIEELSSFIILIPITAWVSTLEEISLCHPSNIGQIFILEFPSKLIHRQSFASRLQYNQNRAQSSNNNMKLYSALYLQYVQQLISVFFLQQPQPRRQQPSLLTQP